MLVPVGRRVLCSFKALSLAWLISGIISTILGRQYLVGSWLWLIPVFGSFCFLAGWVVVGIPIVTLGDRILRMNVLLVMMLTGIGGAVTMLLPTALLLALAIASVPNIGPPVPGAYSSAIRNLFFPFFGVTSSIAFGVAAPTGWLYRKFLYKESVGVPVAGAAR